MSCTLTSNEVHDGNCNCIFNLPFPYIYICRLFNIISVWQCQINEIMIIIWYTKWKRERETWYFMALQQLRSSVPRCGQKITRCRQFKVIPRTIHEMKVKWKINCLPQLSWLIIIWTMNFWRLLSSGFGLPAFSRFVIQCKWSLNARFILCDRNSISTRTVWLRSVTLHETCSTRRPTNRWGSAKCDVTRPTATVVYNACYHVFRKRSCITDYQLSLANWLWQQYDTCRLCNA